MKNSGVFAVSRSVFDHPVFRKEPFTEREAWLWMVGAAAFREMRTRPGKKLITLQRGQLAFAERFMADKFGWPKTRVRRFIARLESESMVDRKADRDITIITICNYDKYAFDGDKRRTTSEPENGPQTDHKRTKEEELKELKTTEWDARATERDAWDLADAFLEAIGVDRDDPGWFGVRRRAEVWRSAGWSREFVVATAKKIMSRRSDVPHINFFEKVFASDFAAQSRPLPEGQKGNEHGKARQHGGSVIAAADTLIARIAEFNKPAPGDNQPGERPIRSGEGARVVRLLPKG